MERLHSGWYVGARLIFSATRRERERLDGEGFHRIGTNTCLPQNGQRELNSLTDRRNSIKSFNTLDGFFHADPHMREC